MHISTVWLWLFSKTITDLVSSLQVGNEISFKLPLASSSSFESMFREIESCMHRSNPGLENPNYPGSDFLGIESYGISVTTLEEVFLRVAGGDFDETECPVNEKPLDTPNTHAEQPNQNNDSERMSYSKVSKNYVEIIGFMFSAMGKACSLFLETTLNVIKFLSMQCCCFSIISRSTFWKHSKALLIKRAVSARRDQKTIVFQLIIPAIFLLLGLLMIKLKPHPDQQSVTFTTSHFNPLLTGGGGGGPIPFDLSLYLAKEVSQLSIFSLCLFQTNLKRMILRIKCFPLHRFLSMLKEAGSKNLEKLRIDFLIQTRHWLMLLKLQGQP